MRLWFSTNFIVNAVDGNANQQYSPIVQYKILKNIEDVVLIRNEWDRLWVESNGAYYQSFACFYQSWDSIHRPRRKKLCCAVAYENDCLIAVLPMVIYRRVFWDVAQICGPESAEGCDILVEPTSESHAIAAMLLRQFLKLASPDLCEFYYVKSGCHLDLAINSLPRFRIAVTGNDAIPYANFKEETDWKLYTQSLSKNFRRNIARANQRLKDQGKVGLDLVRGAPTPAINWMLIQKRRWGERTNKRGKWVFATEYQEFLNKFIIANQHILVFVLKLDEIPIAAQIVAVNSSSVNAIIRTYHEDYKQFSPGIVLDDILFAHIFENYRDRNGNHLDVDFGPGLEQFKLSWSRGNVHPAKNYRIASSSWGLAALYLKRAVGGAKRLYRHAPRPDS